MPYARAGGSIPPPPGYAPSQPAAPQYAMANAFAAPPPPTGYAGGFAGPAVQMPPPTVSAKQGVVLPLSAFEVGDLPRVCVVTGQPTNNMTKVRWHWAPQWTAIFVVFGILPAVLMGHIFGESGVGFLPMAPGVHRRKVLVLWASGFGLCTGFLVALIAAAGSSGLVALTGVAVFVASLVGIVKYSSQGKLRRVAPGYLAVRKAHPGFVQAFQSGRPPGQTPYVRAALPANRHRPIIALAVVIGLCVVAAIGLGAHQAQVCGLGHVHPHRADVDAALNTDSTSLELLTGTGSTGWSPADGQQVLAADEQMSEVLAVTPVKAADRQAVDAYLGAVDRFDQGLRTYMSAPGVDTEQSYHDLGTARNNSAAQLVAALNALPADCSSS